MKILGLAVVASVLTAAYWWTVFTIVYADVLFAGDADPASQPAPDREVLIGNAVAIVVGVVVYAVLSVLWHRIVTRWRSES